MSNIQLIIEERARNIGNFLVGRLLPFSQKRMIGPFIYIDHMGPVALAADASFDVPPHPHIGLSTLTYLLEGSVMHRDSIGTEQLIEAGAVNWMTAGSGVVHSERTPDVLRGKPQHMHGLQIWVALPAKDEEIAPYFTHIPASGLPAWQEGDVHFRLIAGEFGDHKAGVPVHSALYLIELTATADAMVNPAERLFGETGLYVLEGEVVVENQLFGARQLLVAMEPNLCQFEMKAGSKVYLLGGEAFPEQRYIDWNFVSSRPERIDEARLAWSMQQFPKIPNESDQGIPMPDRPKGFKWT
jgi:redox-sensitive bicupin YhaK (pirin superfamily)